MRDRHKISFVLLILFYGISYGQEEISDSIVRLYRIKSSIQQTFFGDNVQPSMTYSSLYNDSGQKIACVWTNNHLNVSDTRQYFTYNSKKQLVSELRVYYTGDDSTTTLMSYEYDEKGDLIDIAADTEIPKTKYKYNSLGNPVERTRVYKEYKVTTTYDYDTLNRLIKETWYVGNVMTATEQIQFNSKGLITERIFTSYFADKKIEKQSKKVYDYNENDLLIKVSSPSLDKDRQTLVFSYLYK